MALAQGREFGTVVCEALGLDPDVTRHILIDIPLDGPVIAYVEQFTSAAAFEVDWGKTLGQIKVVEAIDEAP